MQPKTHFVHARYVRVTPKTAKNHPKEAPQTPSPRRILEQDARAKSFRESYLITIIRALLGIFTAVLRSVTSSLLLLISTIITSIAVVALVGFVAVSLTGAVSLRLSRRRQPPRP